MNATEGHRKTVLVVHNEPAVLVLIQNILIASDYRVLPADGPAHAMRLAQQKHLRIDLVLIDLSVPGISGDDLGEELAAIRPNIALVWMSGWVEDEFIRIKVLDDCNDLLQAIRKALHGDPVAASPKKRPVEQVLSAGQIPWF